MKKEKVERKKFGNIEEKNVILYFRMSLWNSKVNEFYFRDYQSKYHRWRERVKAYFEGLDDKFNNNCKDKTMGYGRKWPIIRLIFYDLKGHTRWEKCMRGV